MTNILSLNPRQQDDLREACLTGLVPCTGDEHDPFTRQRRSNAEQYSRIVAAANDLRRARVAARPASAVSLSYAAREAGLVPHAACIGSCTGQVARNRNAAAVVAFEYRHQTPSVFHVTAWAMAR